MRLNAWRISISSLPPRRDRPLLSTPRILIGERPLNSIFMESRSSVSSRNQWRPMSRPQHLLERMTLSTSKIWGGPFLMENLYCNRTLIKLEETFSRHQSCRIKFKKRSKIWKRNRLAPRRQRLIISCSLTFKSKQRDIYRRLKLILSPVSLDLHFGCSRKYGRKYMIKLLSIFHS
jgi:hypothetical protein